MRAYYLQVLDLDFDASDEAIRKAYRTQSKQYHPDLNHSKNARELFHQVQEAYEYLTEQPQKENLFDYQETLSDQEKYRISAWKGAKEKRLEKEKMQRELIIRVVRMYWPVIALILGFNGLLVLDYSLPYNSYDQEVTGVKQVFEFYRSSGGNGFGSKGTYRYDEVYFEDFKMLFDRGEVKGLDRYEKATIQVTPIFFKPMFLTLKVQGETIQYKQIYNIYVLFGYMMLPIIGVTLSFFLLKKPLHRLNAAIVSTTFFLIQLFIFFNQ